MSLRSTNLCLLSVKEEKHNGSSKYEVQAKNTAGTHKWLAYNRTKNKKNFEVGLSIQRMKIPALQV